MTALRQLSLYEAQLIPAPHNGTDTSIAAAIAAGPKVGTQKRQILDWVRERALGATEDEIEVHCRLLRSAVCARVNELVKEGFLRDSGNRRETRWHRPAAVWVAVTHPVGSSNSDVPNESAPSLEVMSIEGK